MESIDKTTPKRDPLEVVKGFAGILPNKVIHAVPPPFKEAYPNQPDMWPVFKVKPSDGMDFNEDVDADNLYRRVDGKLVSIPGRLRVHKIKQGLKGFRNFKAGSVEIPWPGEVNDDVIRALPGELQNWLLDLIAGNETVSEEESDGLKF